MAAAQPSGTVTIMFTDRVASAALGGLKAREFRHLNCFSRHCRPDRKSGPKAGFPPC